jgi:hypothetical protein
LAKTCLPAAGKYPVGESERGCVLRSRASSLLLPRMVDGSCKPRNIRFTKKNAEQKCESLNHIL